MSDTPRTDVAFDYVNQLREADSLVKARPYYRKFIDGTPLSNDMAVMMVEYARIHADFARTLERENNQLRAALKQYAEAIEQIKNDEYFSSTCLESDMIEKALSLPSVVEALKTTKDNNK